MSIGKWFLTFSCIFFLSDITFASNVETIQIIPPDNTTLSIIDTFQDDKILISLSDQAGKPILDLKKEHLKIMSGDRRATITSVELLEKRMDIVRNFVLVIDNSDSMQQRNAVDPLLAALDELLKIVRPIDQVHLIVFDDQKTMQFGGRDLHVQAFTSSNPVDLKNYLSEAYYGRDTVKTVLFEAMVAGIEIIKQLPADSVNYLLVFSDGDDINSSINEAAVLKATKSVDDYEAYALDYMPKTGVNAFLKQFTEENRGRIWKANEKTDLIPAFQAVSSKMLYQYVVSYSFPPTGKLSIEPDSIVIEEITTLDNSPMLAHVFFDTGSSEIPDRYSLLSGQESSSFNEEKLTGSLEKYYQVLNVIGKRMNDNPDAKMTLVGCNSNSGVERNNTSLSSQRAESVKSYLRYVWGIQPERLNTEARNLPEAPSSSRLQEGKEENQRVEIHSDFPAILDVIESSYIDISMSAEQMILKPTINTLYGVDRWGYKLIAGDEIIAELEGSGDPSSAYAAPLAISNSAQAASGPGIQAVFSVTDKKGQKIDLTADPVKVTFIQKKELLASNMGYKVQEKYALILFDFDSDVIKGRNQAIVDAIASRLNEVPDVSVEIEGHTDNIGKEEYNLKLSERRAKAVYDLLIARGLPENQIRHYGLGAANPLYENDMPEKRALNRTVTITLEYQSSGL